MKKHRIAVWAIVATALFAASAPSWAFQPTQTSTVVAGAFVGGQRVARFNLAIRNTANPFTPVANSSITWTNVDSFTSWKVADQLLVINSTVTDINGGIQIYTDNTSTIDASPRFVDPTPSISSNTDSSAAGLLEGLTGTTSKSLPMAWSIKTTTKTVELNNPLSGIGATDPNNGSTVGYNNKFQWLFVTDKYNTLGIDFDGDGVIIDGGGNLDPGDSGPFVNGAPFIKIRNSSGVHSTQDPADFNTTIANGQNAFVYFQANFTGAAAQTAYQTTTLRLEAFIQ